LNWLAALPILLAFLLRLIPGPRIVDDAYITFRYAQNLAAGNGLVFNPGEAVLGTTTPLYTLILACLSSSLKTGNLPQVAWVLNALLDAGGAALVFWIGKRAAGANRSGTFTGLAASLLWAAAPFSVTFAIGGLETSLVITLLLAAFAFYLSGRDSWAAAALALGTLARPDVLVAAATVFGFMGLRWLRAVLRRPDDGNQGRASFPWRPAATFVLILLPWIVYATSTYGSPLPNSLSAKAVAYHIPREAALVRLLQHFATPFHGELVLGTPWIGVGLILYTTLYAIGSAYAVRREPRVWPLALYPILYAAVYAVANPLIFRWYLSPPIPLFIVGILTGIQALTAEVESAMAARRPRTGRVPHRLAVSIQGVLALLALASLINAWTLHPPGQPQDRPAPEMAWIRLEELYKEVALDLKPDLALSGGRLAAGDIGTLGWDTGAAILDLVGLISPQAQAYYPLPDEAYVINYAVSTDLVLVERPEYIVILEVYGRETLARSDAFLRLYRVWGSYPTDIYDSTAMLVYELRSEEAAP
jgi:hypothetical protein